jgi:alpha-glucoside transport system substrate-binding protein
VAAFKEMYPHIEVTEQGDNNFESLARTRVGSGQAPDILFHPQPGLLRDFYDAGETRILDAPLDRLNDELVGGLVDLATFDGNYVAIPVRLSIKSLVWYNKPVFDASGFAIPETWDELIDITDQIVADGALAPWCIGIESGDATGWVATDWVEDILLRTIGAEQYDAWVAGELDFNSDEVRGALEDYLAPIWTDDDRVFGGRAQIVREAFGTSIAGITGGDDADCVFHRASNALESFITDAVPDAEFGVDYDFFFLPSIDESHGRPALGGGDFAALYSDNPAAIEFMKFLTTAESGDGWASEGAFLSPFVSFDPSNYPDDSTVRAGELLAEATEFRFDGSDAMPADVGSSSQAGSFWFEMTNWVQGNQELEAALANIDALFDSVAS